MDGAASALVWLPASSVTQDRRKIMTHTSKRYATVDGLRMAYTESGAGDPIVFVHGNPTSSYLWRKVIPEVAGLGRCLAPDLIGMGDSDKLPDSGPHSYTYVQHRQYLDGWFETAGATRPVTLAEWPAAATDIFRAFRSPQGEEMVLDKNLFLEAVLPASVLTPLAP